MIASLGGSEATGLRLASTLNPQPSLLLTQTSLCLPGRRHLYLEGGDWKGPNVVMSPLASEPGLTFVLSQPLLLAQSWAWLFESYSAGTADPGGSPSLWT